MARSIILGISAFYHDAAAAIIIDGEVLAAAQEERFTRKKHTPDFPVNAIKFCLQFTGLQLTDIEAVVFYDKPFLKFERLLETYYSFAPKGLVSFIMSMTVWMKEKLFIEKLIKDGLKEVADSNLKHIKFLYPEHHLSHAASTFYVSPFNDAAILNIDGVGEWATVSICQGNGKNIKILKELHFPDSVGLLYSAFTYFLGFRVNSGEYKLMGLAPYGNPGAPETEHFKSIIYKHLVKVYPDGSIKLDQKYFTYATGLRMIKDKNWEQLFGISCRKPDDELQQVHCNLALAIQQVTEDIVLKLCAHAKSITGAQNLCLSGGVALNCVSNGKIQNSGIFKNIFITPAPGDAGGALGAALAAYHIYYGKERVLPQSPALDGLKGAYLGPDIYEQDVLALALKYDVPYTKYNDNEGLGAAVAKLISEGNIIGWVQGRMEFGPRALGARSILADPRNEEMQKKLNLKIKYRESFRPFAPSVLCEDVAQYFEYDGISPYMLLVHGVKENRRLPVPANYSNYNLREKLYYKRSDMPAITHVDFSARIQTVHKHTNPAYYELINQFKKITGIAVLVNTSFNVRGEPIVCTVADAFRCFMRTEMDYLVLGKFVFKKSDCPNWDKDEKWKEEFVLD